MTVPCLLTCCLNSKKQNVLLDTKGLHIDVIAEDEKAMTNPDKCAVLCQRLKKQYSAHMTAVHGLSLAVSEGECFGLVGGNGAGKSTTFNMITGTIPPTAGCAYVSGTDVTKEPKFGYCPQMDAILPELSVVETLRLFSKLIIMLDEPTAGIDPMTRRQVWDLLMAMKSAGTSIILSSHSMEECETLCDRIGFLSHGVMKGIGTSQHLKTTFGNSYTLKLTLDKLDYVQYGQIEQLVQNQFGTGPSRTQRDSIFMLFSVPKCALRTWASLYREVVAFVDANPSIKDFMITETTLEEAFIQTSQENNGITGIVVEKPKVETPTIPNATVSGAPDEPTATDNRTDLETNKNVASSGV
uniref:ABC transporter domain-containing protein n=1 Tax=Panagrolaimus sp. JU765 TaxID=591449 RepID=A0AC34QXI2_9BILA